MTTQTQTLDIQVGIHLTVNTLEMDILTELFNNYNGAMEAFMKSPRIKGKYTEDRMRLFFDEFRRAIAIAREDATKSATNLLMEKR